MNPREVKQCDNCGFLYLGQDLEIVFTGRRRFICYKCGRLGRKQAETKETGHKFKKGANRF